MSTITLLSRIVSGNLYLPCLLVEDAFYSSGYHLMKAWIQAVSKHRKAILIVTEPIYSTFSSLATHVETIDFSIQSSRLFFHALQCIFAKYALETHVTFFLMDLNFPFLLNEQALCLGPCGHLLRSFVQQEPQQQQQQLIALLHTDRMVSEPESLAAMRILFRSTLCLASHSAFLSLDATHALVSGPQRAELCIQTKKGKWKSESCRLTFSGENAFGMSIRLAAKEPCVEANKDELMKTVTSFNVTLTDSQKADRSHVELPYMKAQSALTEGGKVKSAEIIYHPDVADDFDDEDPDADLEI